MTMTNKARLYSDELLRFQENDISDEEFEWKKINDSVEEIMGFMFDEVDSLGLDKKFDDSVINLAAEIYYFMKARA